MPEIETYKPTETGEPPLGRAKKWAWDAEKKEVVDKSLVDNKTVFPLELNTMPGFAGSSAYYLRYMDPHNDEALVSKKADEYWQNVDLYVGGCERPLDLLSFLEQVPLRPRRKLQGRAIPEAGEPGHDSGPL